MPMTPRRLQVLFVTPWYPIPEHAFGGVFVREYASAVQLYHDVTVVHCRHHSFRSRPLRSWELRLEEDVELTGGIPTYRLNYRTLPGLGRLGSISFIWAAFWGLRHLIRQIGRPDVIHAHVCTSGLPAAMVGKSLGIPTVISEHWTAFPRRSLSRPQVFKAKVAFRLADLVLPVSRALQKAIEDYGLHPRVRVVPNTVNTAIFTPVNKEIHGPVRLLYVGALIERKGLPILFQALATFSRKDWVLDIVGEGPELESWRQQVKQLGLVSQIFFHGTKTKKQVAEFLAMADLFVLPSLFETFSVVTIEALASGVPVIATRCGGPEDLVADNDGMLTPPNDAPAMTSALELMLDRLDAFDREAIAAAAAKRFGYEAVGGMLSDIYLQLTNSASSAGEN